MQESNRATPTRTLILLDYSGKTPIAKVEQRPDIQVKNNLVLPKGMSIPTKDYSSKLHFISGYTVHKIESLDNFFKRIDEEMIEFYTRVEKIQLILEKSLVQQFQEQGKEKKSTLMNEKYLIDHSKEYERRDITSKDATNLLIKELLMFSETFSLLNGEELKEGLNFSLNPGSKILMTNTSSPWYSRNSHTYTGVVNFSIASNSSKPSQADMYKLEARIKTVKH